MATTSAPAATNPFLIGHGLPPFDQLQPEQVEPAITQLIADLTAALDSLEQTMTPTWQGLAEPLTKISERLDWTWGVLGHLMGVKNSPELRTAYEAVQPALVQFATRLSQSRAFYNGFKQLAKEPSLSPAQQRIVDAAVRDAELSGVGLDGEAKDQFNQIQQQLAELSTQFSNHVLDATKAFSLVLTTPDDIVGLPPSLLSLAAQNARDAGEETATAAAGPWRITLDIPCYGPFLKHSRRRELRAQLYRAYVSRASSGELDNSPLIDKTLSLRKQQANLLGFDTYADLSVARKMAPSVEAVETLMEELRSASYESAVKELSDLKAFAQAQKAPEADDL